MKLSKTQKELLLKLRGGDRIHFVGYMGRFNPNAYFFLSSDYSKCTAAAFALVDKGLLVKVGSAYKPEYELSEQGKTVPIDGAQADGQPALESSTNNEVVDK